MSLKKCIEISGLADASTLDKIQKKVDDLVAKGKSVSEAERIVRDSFVESEYKKLFLEMNALKSRIAPELVKTYKKPVRKSSADIETKYSDYGSVVLDEYERQKKENADSDFISELDKIIASERFKAAVEAPKVVSEQIVQPEEKVAEKWFKTHTGEVVSGKRLTVALNKAADKWAELQRAIRKEDKYAPHVTVQEKDDNLRKGLATAEQIRRGEKNNEFWAWQRINEELTGENVPFLPDGKSSAITPEKRGTPQARISQKRQQAKPTAWNVIETVETAQKVAKEPTNVAEIAKEEQKVVKATGIKPTNLRDVYKAGRDVFGLNKAQALAQAIVVDNVIGKIAKRRGVTKEKVYSEIEFRKGLAGGKVAPQKGKGAIEILEDGKAIISALTDPNVSTPLHEIAHLYEKYMTTDERQAVLNWTGDKTWSVNTSEKFARGFENYLATGKAPRPSLQKVFDRFKKWLTEIYNGITGSEIDIELNDAMRDVYAAMLGEDVVTKVSKKVKQERVEPKSTGFADVDALLFQMESVPKTIDVDGVQRPTTNSNGQQIHPTLEGIKNFWKWFGNSKVVDKEGRPLVVYHGSPIGDITEFGLNKNESESSGLRQVAYYFTTNRKIAEVYRKKRLSELGKSRIVNEIYKLEQLRDNVRNNTDWDEYTRQIDYLKGGRIYETYLKAEDIKEFDAKGGDFESWKELKIDLGYKTAYGYDAIDAIAGRNSAAWGNVKKDGIHAKNIIELSTFGKANNDEFLGDAYAVFKPTQIKSAIENVGTFDENTGNILFQEDKTEKYTKAVNLLIDKAESAKEDVEKFVREKLALAGNPVSEKIITNVLKERGYAEQKSVDVLKEIAKNNPLSLLKVLDSTGLTKRKC